MNKKLILKSAIQESREGKNLPDSKMIEIVKKYTRQIIVPKIKPKKQFIICPIGLVGAGKTTVIKPISKKLNMVRISSDEIRKILKIQEFNYKRTAEIALKIVLKFLNRGYSIALDGDTVAPDKQKYFKNLERERKITIIWIHIKPPEKFIINKLKNYKHTWLFKNADQAIANYKRRKPLHQKYLSRIKFFYKFDPSRKDLNGQIKKFIKKLKTTFY